MTGLGKHDRRREQHEPVNPRHPRRRQDGEGAAQARSHHRHGTALNFTAAGADMPSGDGR